MPIPIAEKPYRLRRAACALAIALSAAVLAPQPAVQGQSAQKPNIVVIMIDDYDLTSLAALAQTGLMPNLRKYFLDTGDWFLDSFTVAGYGGPARASFFTGQYPHNHRVLGFEPDGVERMNASSTVATWLQAAGYRTSHVGRYVTGYGWWTSKTAIPPGWNEWSTLIDPTSNNTVEYKMNINGSVLDVGALADTYDVELHQVDVVGALAADFARRGTTFGQPFFLVAAPGVFNLATTPPFNDCPGTDVPSYAPLFEGSVLGAGQKPPDRYMNTIFGNATAYPLIQWPSFNEADISDKPAGSAVGHTALRSEAALDCIQKRYWRKLEGMRAVDDLIGMIMGALEQNGALDNTIATFTADNGWLDGQHRLAGKGVPYEEAIRVPLFIRTPASTQARYITKMVLTTDLAPTIAEWAGATPTHAVDGRSLVPLLQDPNITQWRNLMLVESLGDWDPFADTPLPPTFNAIRTGRARPRTFARYPTTLWQPGELYNLTADPFQLQNQYWEPSSRAERDWLELWLNLMLTCSGTRCQTLETYFYFN